MNGVENTLYEQLKNENNEKLNNRREFERGRAKTTEDKTKAESNYQERNKFFEQ